MTARHSAGGRCGHFEDNRRAGGTFALARVSGATDVRCNLSCRCRRPASQSHGPAADFGFRRALFSTRSAQRHGRHTLSRGCCGPRRSLLPNQFDCRLRDRSASLPGSAGSRRLGLAGLQRPSEQCRWCSANDSRTRPREDSHHDGGWLPGRSAIASSLLGFVRVTCRRRVRADCRCRKREYTIYDRVSQRSRMQSTASWERRLTWTFAPRYRRVSGPFRGRYGSKG